MGKNDKKASKAGKDEKKKKSGTATTPIAAPAPAVTGAYADGAPLDKVTYLEAKLILKPDRFTSVESFRNFGKLV
ncbi:MAG: hypothetical protein WBW69_21355, partial [Candidatus Korobacteraceae bacterium]